VRVCVRAIQGKRLALSTPKSVVTPFMTGARHALTLWLKVKGQRSKEGSGLQLGWMRGVWVCMSIPCFWFRSRIAAPSEVTDNRCLTAVNFHGKFETHGDFPGGVGQDGLVIGFENE